MIKMGLVDFLTKKSLAVSNCAENEKCLVTSTVAKAIGHFFAVTRTSAGTTAICTPTGSGGIVLTDLIITSDKVNAATVTVQFTDGVNTVVIATAHVTDAPCNIAIPIAGRWEGWQGARIDVVTVGVVTVGVVKTTVSCGYYKISENVAVPYAEWNARR